MKISDPWIAKEAFENISKIKQKLDYNKWVDFIESNLDYFTWLENTDKGKKTMKNINLIPEGFKKAVIEGHKKKQVCAEFNDRKGYHEVIIKFNEELGVLGTTFQKPITKFHLKWLIEMAEHLDAFVLNNGRVIIDESFVKKMS